MNKLQQLLAELSPVDPSEDWKITRNKAISAANKGKNTGPSDAKKAQQKLVMNRPEVRAKLSAAATGKTWSDEARAKASKTRAGRKQSPEHIAKRVASKLGKKYGPQSAEARAKKCRACTVDGITIYTSRKELIEALGLGKAGLNHPSFRYI